MHLTILLRSKARLLEYIEYSDILLFALSSRPLLVASHPQPRYKLSSTHSLPAQHNVKVMLATHAILGSVVCIESLQAEIRLSLWFEGFKVIATIPFVVFELRSLVLLGFLLLQRHATNTARFSQALGFLGGVV